MAERSGFFDAHLVNGEYDRVYLAEHFARYFASFIGNGVFAGKSNELMVKQKESADMSVRVLTGQGFINGYFYENTDELSLAIDTADGVLDRIDLIVLRLDKSERSIRALVEKGTPAFSPSMPVLKRNDDYYELALAKILVEAGATKITQANIVDARLDSDVCGFVAGVVKQFDTTEFGRQLESFVEQYSDYYVEQFNQYNEEYLGWLAQRKETYNGQFNQQVEAFRAWFRQFEIDSNADVDNLINHLDDLVKQFDDIIAAGDLSPIILEIQNLKDRAIESEDHPGCHYRLVEGEIEWLNPPMEPGVEYKTTERFEGRPVYKMLVHVQSLPNTSMMIVTPNAMLSKMVSMEGVLFDSATSYTEVYPFPVFMSSSVAPDAMIINAMPGLQWTNIAILTTRDLTRYKADIIIKYVK